MRRGAGSLVKPGMRAYSIQATNAASNVAGLILPGDRVDVILSVDSSSGDRAEGGTSYTLLQNAEILAVNQRLDAPADDRPETKLATVTLLVTQQDASLLGLAQRSGSLSLSLRNPEDELIAEQSPISLSSLRGLPQVTGVAGAETDVDQAGFAGDAVGPGVGSVGLVQETSEPVDSNTAKSAIRTLRGTQSGSVAITISKNR
jgi:Flp pilus assembly protein CpaB